jgi:hypothetical protein
VPVKWQLASAAIFAYDALHIKQVAEQFKRRERPAWHIGANAGARRITIEPSDAAALPATRNAALA